MNALITVDEVMRLADEYAQQRVDNWAAYDRKREQVQSARAALERAVRAVKQAATEPQR